MTFRLPASFLGFVSLTLAAGCSGPVESAVLRQAPAVELLATYWPTPERVVRGMLDLGELQPGETHFDLGSGDGRIVAAAARRGARSTGFEIDPELIAISRARLRESGLHGKATIEAGDLLAADFSRANLITCFLTPEAYPKLVPRLEAAMRPGSRLVAYKFPIPGWRPEEVRRWDDPDPAIPTHEVFLYRR